MGFTKSEVDSDLYIMLVEFDPLILVLYMDDLFLIGAEELIVGLQGRLGHRFRDEGHRLDALLLGVRDLSEIESDLP